MTTATEPLGIKGGEPVRSRPFPAPPALGEAERRAVNAVLDSGVLSQFIGVWGEDFYGGPRVRSRSSGPGRSASASSTRSR